MATHYKGSLREEAVLNAFIALMRAAGSVSQRSSAHLKESEVTAPQFAVLEALLHLGPLKQCELARKLLTSPGNLSLLLSTLEKQSWIKREAHKPDRRSTTVSLTAAGEKVITPLFKKNLLELTSAFSSMNLEELEQLRALCRKLGLAQSEPAQKPCDTADTPTQN